MNSNKTPLNTTQTFNTSSILEIEMHEDVETPEQTMKRILNIMFNMPKLPDNGILAIHRKGVSYDKIFFHEPIDMLEALIASDSGTRERIKKLGYTAIHIYSNKETKFRTIWPIQSIDEVHPNLG